ncbi:hypothetical protein JVU11DRAFT_10488 [Chiua virens]|nr:hypothetical protein JVU11DRAFT_10488 [Chiua virens]
MAHILSRFYFLLSALSGLLMGMNCVLYLFCAYVLWGQKCPARRFVLVASTVQFSLSSAQAVLYVTYLISAFGDHAQDTESYFQQISELSLPCYIIYVINFAIEGLLLIWRTYILYNHNLLICIPSIILLALQIGFGSVTAKGFATEVVFTGSLHAFNLVTWALIAAVNATATVLMCMRLWVAHKRTHIILQHSSYKSTMIVVVECGVLVTVFAVAMLILYAVANPGALAGLGFTTQVATMAPLLIVARHEIVSRRNDRDLLASQVPLRVNIERTEHTRVDVPASSPTLSTSKSIKRRLSLSGSSSPTVVERVFSKWSGSTQTGTNPV